MTLHFEAIDLVAGGRRILDGIDARFERGRVTVILGPNGAGKSSLLACAVALRKPSHGRALLDGEDIAHMPPRRRGQRIGYLPQSAELHWNLAGREVVALGRFPHRGPFAGPSAADEAAIERAMTATDTHEFAERMTAHLSGGERARVLLARVLAGEPDWLLADEPLVSLDPSHQIDILDRFRETARRGAGVVLVLHELSQAARVADDVLLLKDGRVVAFGPVSETLRPDALRHVYGVEVHIGHAPGGEPLLVPLRRSDEVR